MLLALSRMRITSLESAFILLIMYYWKKIQSAKPLMQLKSELKQFIKLLTMKITIPPS